MPLCKNIEILKSGFISVDHILVRFLLFCMSAEKVIMNWFLCILGEVDRKVRCRYFNIYNFNLTWEFSSK